MYGTQTAQWLRQDRCTFENDVKMYGTQTNEHFLMYSTKFENDVKMYGTQTSGSKSAGHGCLRMM